MIQGTEKLPQSLTEETRIPRNLVPLGQSQIDTIMGCYWQTRINKIRSRKRALESGNI